MTDAECVAFLQWALPQLRLRWHGFRRVRRQVCRRVSRRIAELGLKEADAYRAYLEGNLHEWNVLAGLCRITISRFWRDRELLSRQLSPAVDLSPRSDRLVGVVRSARTGAPEAELLRPRSLR
jgi:chemotaxis protein methyltransferase CheR